MIRRAFVACAALAALTVVLTVRAQEPPRPQDKGSKLKEDLALQQQNLARRFGEFQQQLLRLQQRLEKSPRKEDQDKVQECLKKQGGLDKCTLTFYKEGDIGDDGEWDNWRLEGPGFVWYFRGSPHVHVWVNVASDPSIKLNARG